MRLQNHWWILLLAAALLAASGCTENDLDESDADVILEVTSISNPSVEGEVQLGTCSVSGNECLDIDDCPDTEFCDLPLDPGECTINDWTVNLSNKPLNEGGGETPFNDVVVQSVILGYDTTGDGNSDMSSEILLGTTIEANGQGTVSFAPITFDLLTAVGGNRTIDLVMIFDAETISGNDLSVTAGAQLFIEDCVP